MIILEILFWLAVFLLLYTYLGYPGLIALLARFWSLPVHRRPIRPAVSLLIIAYNEGRVIRQKVENSLALDYPRQKLEIVIASDGSTDRTVEIAREYEARGVTVIAFERRRGKPSVLNDVIPKCKGQIIVLGDARQIYDGNAILSLVENFADPSVGAVSGELHLTNPSGVAVGTGLGFYWQYEKFIRRHESRLGSTVGATGAIYAIRGAYFEPIPVATLLDDVLIPLRIVRRGYRVVFEHNAKARDQVATTFDEEFKRKVRTIAGTLQLFARERWLWSVRRNPLWLQALSHKLLRILGPFLLIAAFAANAFLAASHPLYRLALGAQLLFYGAAVGGSFFGNRSTIGRWLSVPHAFCLLNLTTLVGVMHFLRGAQTVTWGKAVGPSGPREAVELANHQSGS